MIRIDHIQVRLPYIMQRQAPMLTRHLTNALSRLEFSRSVELKFLSLPTIKIKSGQSINDLANHMANQIYRFVEGDRT